MMEIKPIGLSKRYFLKYLCGGIAVPFMAWAKPTEGHAPLLASAAFNIEGKAHLCIFTAKQKMLLKLPLPLRGHAIAYDKNRAQIVSFSRRPGIYALAYDMVQDRQILFEAGKHRHFYGHGIFSHDGALLYASENDYAAARGMIGVYDANNYKKINEFYSGAIGPHQIALHPNQKDLIIANGGIETHPDYGRQKLNLAEMHSNITFMNGMNGTIIKQYKLPKAYQQLSIRHFTISQQGEVIFACQYQGNRFDEVPLIGAIKHGEIKLWALDHTILKQCQHYISSIHIDDEKQRICATSARGNIVLILSPKTQKIIDYFTLSKASGVTSHKGDFFITAHHDMLNWQDSIYAHPQNHAPLIFDNHLSLLV